MSNLSRRNALAAVAGGLTAAALPAVARAAGKIDKIGIDFAYYNPVSLVLKDKGWVRDAAAARIG